MKLLKFFFGIFIVFLMCVAIVSAIMQVQEVAQRCKNGIVWMDATKQPCCWTSDGECK